MTAFGQARPPWEERKQVKRILVATDFSKNADHALQYALTFARVFSAKLYLLHVVSFPAYTSPQTLRLPGDAISQVLADMVKEAKRRLKMLVEKTKEPQVILPPVVLFGPESRVTGVTYVPSLYKCAWGWITGRSPRSPRRRRSTSS